MKKILSITIVQKEAIYYKQGGNFVRDDLAKNIIEQSKDKLQIAHSLVDSGLLNSME